MLVPCGADRPCPCPAGRRRRHQKMLTRLEANGFKNLVDFALDFGPYTCIAGANGVGKSNIFDAIRFVSLLNLPQCAARTRTRKPRASHRAVPTFPPPCSALAPLQPGSRRSKPWRAGFRRPRLCLRRPPSLPVAVRRYLSCSSSRHARKRRSTASVAAALFDHQSVDQMRNSVQPSPSSTCWRTLSLSLATAEL